MKERDRCKLWKISISLRNEQNNDLKKDIIRLEKVKETKGNTAATFMLKNEVVGNKKKSVDPTAIVNPKTNEKVKSVSEIKSVALEYCIDLLTNREAKVEYKQIIDIKTQLHNIRMEKNDKNEPELTRNYL